MAPVMLTKTATGRRRVEQTTVLRATEAEGPPGVPTRQSMTAPQAATKYSLDARRKVERTSDGFVMGHELKEDQTSAEQSLGQQECGGSNRKFAHTMAGGKQSECPDAQGRNNQQRQTAGNSIVKPMTV